MVEHVALLTERTCVHATCVVASGLLQHTHTHTNTHTHTHRTSLTPTPRTPATAAAPHLQDGRVRLSIVFDEAIVVVFARFVVDHISQGLLEDRRSVRSGVAHSRRGRVLERGQTAPHSLMVVCLCRAGSRLLVSIGARK